MNRDKDFEARRIEARKIVNSLDNTALKTEPKREGFFNMVYERAGEDAAQVPWADLDAKPQLKEWLGDHPPLNNNTWAIDVACGLGDHAEAMAAAGYQTTAFDLADSALKWAKKRFPESNVNYRKADLFDLPEDWHEGFDLVYECYTIQAVPPELHSDIAKAIASLVAPGGTLLVLARIRAEDEDALGPPWHLAPHEYNIFNGLGFVLQSESIYKVTRSDKAIPHIFAEWRKEE